MRKKLDKRFTLSVDSDFRTDVKILEERYGTRGLSETVREIVRVHAKKARRDIGEKSAKKAE